MSITILDKAGCAKAIGAIRRVGAKLQERIHVVAVSALAHIRDHGDTTIATNLMDALPRGQRVKALALWFSHFSNGKLALMQDKQSGKWVATLAKLKDRMESDFDVDGAMLVTFADLTVEKDPVVKKFTVEDLVKKLTDVANGKGSATLEITEDAQDFAANILAAIEQPAAPRLKLVANG